jgi:hypothetical protein
LNTSEKYFVNEEVSEVLLFDKENGKYLKIPQIIYSK